jgi:hypothetical protein
MHWSSFRHTTALHYHTVITAFLKYVVVCSPWFVHPSLHNRIHFNIILLFTGTHSLLLFQLCCVFHSHGKVAQWVKWPGCKLDIQTSTSGVGNRLRDPTSLWLPGCLSWSVKLTTERYLIPGLRMSGSIPPLPVRPHQGQRQAVL